MALKIVDTYRFKKGIGISDLIQTKDYIVGFENSGTVGDAGGIYLFDKNMALKRTIPFKIMGYEITFAKPEHNTLALFASDKSILTIVDLETGLAKEIPLPPTSESDALYPSKFYWWQGDILLIHTIYKKYYRINVASSEISPIDSAYIQSNFPEFKTLLEYADKYFNVIDVNPLALQFTYYNERKNELGFVDIRKDTVHKVFYLSKDIHSAHFYKNRFIVFGCYSIEEVTSSEVKTTYFEIEKNYQFQKALFIEQSNELVAYWHGIYHASNGPQESVLRITFDDTIGKLSAADKERSTIYAHLKNNPIDSAAWLRLILVDYYDSNRLSGRWDYLYSNDIYEPLIHAHMLHTTTQKIKKSSGLLKLLYNQLSNIPEANPTLTASLELAKAWLSKKMGAVRKYESALLKSIEYGSDHVNNYIALGDLYIEQGKTQKGKELLQKALANIKKVYADESEKTWDRYDIQEFMNEYYKGIYQSKEKYDELVSLLKS